MDARELDSVGRRPFRAWSEDGLPDIFSGALFLLLGSVNWAMYSGSPALLLLFLAAAFTLRGPLGRRAMRRAKERLTFPRTGRIELRKQKVDWKRVLLVYLLLMGLWGLTLVNMETSYRWLPVGCGLALGGALLWGASISGSAGTW